MHRNVVKEAKFFGEGPLTPTAEFLKMCASLKPVIFSSKNIFFLRTFFVSVCRHDLLVDVRTVQSTFQSVKSVLWTVLTSTPIFGTIIYLSFLV